jgi:leader peptidase (prepilin peptidase)/N-methyltransferase
MGWVAGSLVNYFSDVLPYRRKLTAPFCLACEAPQRWVNYLFWPRRCPSCSSPRTGRAWWVEVAYIIMGIWLWQSFPEGLGFWLSLLLLTYFGVVVVIDIEHRLILHPVSWFGAVLGIGIGSYLHGVWNAVLGGVVGYGCMFVLFLLGVFLMRLIQRRRGKLVDDTALGFGDVNLSGVLGLLLGWPGVVGGLMFAVFIGGAFSLGYLLLMLAMRRYRAFSAIPYGPFLIAGAVILLFFQKALANLILK